jgi:hypothetical protein
MASTTSKWLAGCGIGCGVVILLIIIVIGVGYLFVRDTVQDFKETETSMEILEDAFGDVRDFCPDTDGRIRPDRLEAFLAVRDSIIWIRDEIEQSLGNITDDVHSVEEEDRPFWRVLGIIRKGVGAIPKLAEYYTARNYALLDEGMGLGEYYYIYAVGYYSWLGKLPEDGPEFQMMGDDGGYTRYRWEEDEEGETRDWQSDDVREQRRYRIIRIVNRMVLAMLRNQLEKLEEQGAERYSRSWRGDLEAEIEALRNDRDRLPWKDGLPEVIQASFRPYRDRLEASYNALINPLEIMPNNNMR